MRGHSFIALVLAAVLSLLISGLGESAQVTKPPAEDAAVAKQSAAKTQDKAGKRAKVDPDQAYKANCLRCHWEPRKLSEREMATIMRHMRVRANLTDAEARAILEYLTR